VEPCKKGKEETRKVTSSNLSGCSLDTSKRTSAEAAEATRAFRDISRQREGEAASSSPADANWTSKSSDGAK